MAYFSTIKLNGAEIIRPNDFSPQREDVYAAELQTLKGRRLADVIGWRYSEMTMQWDALPEEHLQVLLNMSGATALAFTDADGQEHTETIIRTSAVTTATRTEGPDGTPLWKNVNVGINFMDIH